MKRYSLFVMLLALLLSIPGWSQKSHVTGDSALIIINNYIKLLNYDALKKDSMLYIESSIVNLSDTTDTIIMKRWHIPPYCHRTEMWHKDTLQFGLITDAATIFKRYDIDEHRWNEISVMEYYDIAPGYDFHGPFFKWETSGWEVRYDGIFKFNGNDVYKIYVRAPERFDRYYLFDKSNGLLFFIDELDSHKPDSKMPEDKHVNWRGYHEYTPLGTCLFLTAESYLYDNSVTILHHNVRYVAQDKSLFK